MLQDEIGDDARAVTQSDQGEQRFMAVGLGGDVWTDTQLSEPLVCGSARESLPWQDEGFIRGSELPVGRRDAGLDEDERTPCDLPGEQGGGNPGWKGCDGKVGFALVEQGKGGRGVTGAQGDAHARMRVAQGAQQVGQKAVACSHGGEHPQVPLEFVVSSAVGAVTGP